MFYKIGKKLFNILDNFLHFMQVFSVFLSFFIILYWIFEIAGATFIQPFAPFFEGIKEFTHLFYSRNANFDNVTLDFSFLIASLVILFFAWVLNFLIEYMHEAEEKYDSVHEVMRKNAEKVFNADLERQHMLHETKNDKILMLINFSASNLTKDKFFSKYSEVGVEEVQKEALYDIFQILDEDSDCNKNLTEKGLFLFFENFSRVDDFLSVLESSLSEVKNKFLIDRWQLDSFVCVDVYENPKELEVKKEKLINLGKLMIKNEVICSGTFKERYYVLKKQKHSVKALGVYQVFGEYKEIFCIKSLK